MKTVLKVLISTVVLSMINQALAHDTQEDSGADSYVCHLNLTGVLPSTPDHLSPNDKRKTVGLKHFLKISDRSSCADLADLNEFKIIRMSISSRSAGGNGNFCFAIADHDLSNFKWNAEKEHYQEQNLVCDSQSYGGNKVATATWPNMKTFEVKKGQKEQSAGDKHWLLVSEGNVSFGHMIIQITRKN